MNKSLAIKISSVVIIIIVCAIVALILRRPLSNRLEVLTEGQSISLQSKVPSKTLIWENKQALEQVLAQLEIFNIGARDIKTNNTEPVDNVVIVYTPETQATHTNITPDRQIISGASYVLSNRTLTVTVSVNEELVPDNDINTAFNQKVIELLVGLSPTTSRTFSSSGASTSIDERMNYFYGILKDKFSESPYPIKII